MFALNSSKKLVIAALYATALVVVPSALAQDDPPSEAGRISFISGNVSIQSVTSDDWGQVYPNLPVGPGDRIFTDSDGRAEIQLGQTYIRVGPNSDVTLVDDSTFNIHVGIAQGSIRLHSFGLWPRQLLDVSTPNGNAEFANSGDLRVDVLPNDGATIFTNLGQFADITGAGDFRQELDYGQSLELAGSNPVYPQWLQPAGPDDLDYWSQQRDQQLARVVSFQYVSPDIPGAADLDAYGDWQPQTEYGAVWFPRDVPADWQPYHYGHWIDRQPWGWVWVEDESWGYAPFHYGRWVSYNGQWGWVPGPVHARPIWSPALVVFAGGVHFGGGASLSVWFPLGPGEAYRPWYRCSPRYIDQVNITNIREAPRVHVQNTYVNVVNVTNITYINQTRGASAVRQGDFASGRSVHNVAVRVDPREMQQARALQQPEVVAAPRATISRPVARPVPVSIQRPVLINQQGKQIAARPNATPVAAPVRPEPQVKPLPGRTIVAAPAHAVPNRAGGNQYQTPAAQSNQEQRPNSPNLTNPGGAPRANPVGPVQGIQRPLNPQLNQNPPANNTYEHQQGPQPVVPGVQPSGRPASRPQNMQEDRPNQTPNYNQRQPQGPQPVAPGVQPTGRDAPAPQNMQQDRPNNQQLNYQQQRRPTPPPLQNPPATQYHQEYGPVQPNKHNEVTPPPANNPPQERPAPPPPQHQREVMPPQRPAYQPQERPAPPPPSRQAAPPQQSKPQPNDQKQNNKDPKKDDKKHD